MNFVSKLTSLPNLLMNNFSSVFLASDNFAESFLSSDNILTRLLRAFSQFFYFACKWLMYMVDVVYFYILQLVGVTTDTTIFDSAKSDPAFRLLIDNKEEVTTYIKNFVAIAIILIIVTAVIAIVKQQAQAMKDAKPKKSPTSDVLKSMFKSVILIIVTPLIAILGIVASSVMLQGLYRATNLSDAKSLSGRIFNASATAANKYKSYADTGVRIPIKYCFSGDDKADAIVYAATMVGNNSFPRLDYFNENENFPGKFYDPVYTDKEVEKGSYGNGAQAWLNETYYKYFDRSDDYNKEYDSEKFKIMTTHANEYYAMSDVIGYALDTIEPYYFVTIQELLESVKDETELLKSLVEGYKIFPLDGSGNVTATTPAAIATKIQGKDYSFLQYTSEYEDGSHTYVHIKDAVDEMEGAKFTIAYKIQTNILNYTESINGDYSFESGAYRKVEKYFYKESNLSRYKVVDLYYILNEHNGRYEKATSYTPGQTYYYRIGENYHLIDTQNEGKFFYRLDDGSYKNLTMGQIFHSATKTEFYMPLAVGVSVNNNPKFASEYIKPSNIITARGIFDEASYPTAIRRLNNGNIMFYRDDLEIVTEGAVSDVGKIEEIEAEEEEDSEDGGFLNKVGGAIKSAWNSVKTFVTSIFNPLKLVPDLAIDESKISSTYTNKTKSVAELEDGKLHISYFFSDNVTSRLTKNMYSLNLNHLFEPLSINYIVLVFGSVILFKVILTAVFGIINRAISLFMMILIYPLACSTIPLDDVSGTSKTGSYAKWSERYTKLLFSTFGLLLSINFVFIIIPAIDKLVFFTPENLQNNKALARIADALYNPLHLLHLDKLLELMGFTLKKVEPNYHLISAFINKILRIIFQISAFSLLSSPDGKGGGADTFYTVIQNIVKPGGEGILEDSPIDAVKKTMKNMATAFNIMFFPGKAIKNIAEKSKETMKEVADNVIPLNAVGKDIKSRAQEMGLRIDQDEARKALLKALNSHADKSEVESKLEKFKSTHNVK